MTELFYIVGHLIPRYSSAQIPVAWQILNDEKKESMKIIFQLFFWRTMTDKRIAMLNYVIAKESHERLWR